MGSFEQCVRESNGKMTLAFQNKESDNDELPQDQAQQSDSALECSTSPNTEVNDSTESVNNKNEHKEMSNTGIVKRDTFVEYLKAMPGGIWAGVVMMILFIVTQGCVLGTIAAIGLWSNLPGEQQSSWDIISIVIGLVLAVCFFAIIRAFLSFFFTVEASKRLHDQMTRSVLRSKIEFFDVSITCISLYV
jgi:ATP-binding cassette subfamily C (CFTR/MRP) protein 4